MPAAASSLPPLRLDRLGSAPYRLLALAEARGLPGVLDMPVTCGRETKAATKNFCEFEVYIETLCLPCPFCGRSLLSVTMDWQDDDGPETEKLRPVIVYWCPATGSRPQGMITNHG